MERYVKRVREREREKDGLKMTPDLSLIVMIIFDQALQPFIMLHQRSLPPSSESSCISDYCSQALFFSSCELARGISQLAAA